MAEWVWMHNAETGGTQRFAAGAVDDWAKAGWVPCDPPTEPNLAIDPNHPALAVAPQEPEAPPQTTGADRRPASKSSTGRAPASDKEE